MLNTYSTHFQIQFDNFPPKIDIQKRISWLNFKTNEMNWFMFIKYEYYWIETQGKIIKCWYLLFPNTWLKNSCRNSKTFSPIKSKRLFKKVKIKIINWNFLLHTNIYPNLEVLDLSDSLVCVVKGGKFFGKCLPRIQKLVLRYNKIMTLGRNL